MKKVIALLLTLVLTLSIVCLSALAETANVPDDLEPIEGFEAFTFTGSNGATVRYRIREGSAYNQPLMIWMHGGGAVGNDNIAQINANSKASLTLAAYSADWTILAAQYPGRDFSGFAFDEDDWFGAYAELVNELVSSGQVDAGRVYVGGGSLGGYTTWKFCYMYPELFAAVLSCCPAISLNDEELLMTGMDKIIEAKLPIRMYHAVGDEAVPEEYSVGLYNYLRKFSPDQDVEFTFLTQEDVLAMNHPETVKQPAHNTGWSYALQGEEFEALMDWMWAQKK